MSVVLRAIRSTSSLLGMLGATGIRGHEPSSPRTAPRPMDPSAGPLRRLWPQHAPSARRRCTIRGIHGVRGGHRGPQALLLRKSRTGTPRPTDLYALPNRALPTRTDSRPPPEVRRVRLPRPVLIAILSSTAATGSLLLAPPSATADREPPVREGAGREGTDQPTGAAGAPANAARNALTSLVTDLSELRPRRPPPWLSARAGPLPRPGEPGGQVHQAGPHPYDAIAQAGTPSNGSATVSAWRSRAARPAVTGSTWSPSPPRSPPANPSTRSGCAS